MRAWSSYLVLWLASACLAFAVDSCFLNTDWKNVVAGKPIVLAWVADVYSFWDVLLNVDVRTQATLVGAVARMSLLPLPRRLRSTTARFVLTRAASYRKHYPAGCGMDSAPRYQWE